MNESKPIIITHCADDVYDKFWRKQKPNTRVCIDSYENEIAKIPGHACAYAKYVLGGRFHKGENAIYSDLHTSAIYIHFLESLNDQ
jgi:hypothetical protein